MKKRLAILATLLALLTYGYYLWLVQHLPELLKANP